MLANTVLLIVLLSATAFSQQKHWTLPVADGGDVKRSPPSVHGYVVDAGKQRLTVRRASHSKNAEGTPGVVQLTSKTQFFTAYGGDYSPDELRAGQYVWVWFITADPAKAGTPPRAAVVMLWSTNVSDKPSAQVRWRFDSAR